MTRKTTRLGSTSTRRGFLGGAAAGAALLSTPFVRSASAAERVIYANTWGGDWEQHAKASFFDPFSAETGIEVRTVSPISFAKLATQKRTGTYEFDVTSLGVADAARANRAGLLANLEEKFAGKDLYDGAIYENGLVLYGFANMMAYDKTKFDAPIDSWAKFFDTETYPGPRSMQRHAIRAMAYALLADGVAPEDLFPYDIERGFAALDRIKPEVRVWWSAGPQARQILTDGEVSAAAVWDSDAYGAMDATNGNVVPVWDGAIVDTACWVAAKDSPREEFAVEFLGFIADRPDLLAEFCTTEMSAPMNPAAFDYIDDATAALMPTNPEIRDRVVFLDGAKIVDQIDEINDRFESWIAF